MEHSPAFLEVVTDAKSRIRECTVDHVKTLLDTGHTFYLIDVREDMEWKEGRVPTAIHIGKGVLERDIEKAVPSREAEIVLYCGGGYRSALAADTMQKMGYLNVTSMDGGVRGWKDAGYPFA